MGGRWRDAQGNQMPRVSITVEELRRWLADPRLQPLDTLEIDFGNQQMQFERMGDFVTRRPYAVLDPELGVCWPEAKEP